MAGRMVGPIRSWTYSMGVCPERFSDAGRTGGESTPTFEMSAHETGGSADVAPNPSARERGEFSTICTAPPLNCASACCELAPLEPYGDSWKSSASPLAGMGPNSSVSSGSKTTAATSASFRGWGHRFPDDRGKSSFQDDATPFRVTSCGEKGDSTSSMVKRQPSGG